MLKVKSINLNFENCTRHSLIKVGVQWTNNTNRKTLITFDTIGSVKLKYEHEIGELILLKEKELFLRLGYRKVVLLEQKLRTVHFTLFTVLLKIAKL